MMKATIWNDFDGMTAMVEGYRMLLGQKVPRGQIGNTVEVAIRDGEFRGSDIVSMVILRLVFGGVRIVRTNDEELISQIVDTKGGYAVGVGGVYNPGRRYFDHQVAGTNCSSADLLWKEYGPKIMRDASQAADIVRRFIAGIDSAGADGAAMPFGVVLELFNSSFREKHPNDPYIDYYDEAGFVVACQIAESIFLRAIENAHSAVYQQEWEARKLS